jgi:acyl-CoA synthetase (AMP-forming)/AMP-acid ligase II
MSDLILGQDWLRPVHHLGGRPFGSTAGEPGTIVGALARHARAIPNARFLSEIGDGARMVTYQEAHRAVQRQAAFLLANGLARGDRVGVIGPNSIAFALAVLAILEAGGVAVLLSRQDPPTRIAAQADFAQVGILLHDASCVGLAETCATDQQVVSFPQLGFLSRQYDSAATATPRPTDAGLIFYTSGTTGVPKAVVQSHFAIAQNAWSLAEHHRLRPGTQLLCVLPMHHVNGLEFTVFAAMLGGAHTVISPGFDGLRFWGTLRERNVEIASLVPNILRLLAARPELRGRDGTPLRYVVSAAAPLSTAIAQQAWDRLRLRIVQGYGLSEATNFSCLMPTDLNVSEYARWMLNGRRTSIGSALPNQDVEVLDSDKIAAPGVEGEIVIRGHCVMSGYLHNTTATEEMFRGGWVHTGDVGYSLLDEQGRKFFHISGRIREIAKRGGTIVSLLELDEILARIPGVADAGAASFANEWVDEEIAALVVRQPDAAITEKSIIDHCRTLLAFAATPKRIEFVEEVPRTASGKIRRAVIAERFARFRDHLFREDTLSHKQSEERKP